jgi:hypothetical protein
LVSKQWKGVMRWFVTDMVLLLLARVA